MVEINETREVIHLDDFKINDILVLLSANKIMSSSYNKVNILNILTSIPFNPCF